jgi:hypothetical protein
VAPGDWALSAIELSQGRFEPKTLKLLFTTESRIFVGPVVGEVDLGGQNTKVIFTPPCMTGVDDDSMVCQILPVDGPNGAKWRVEALRARAVGVLEARDGAALNRLNVALPSMDTYNLRFLGVGEGRPISPGDIVLLYQFQEPPSTSKRPELLMALVFSHAQEISSPVPEFFWMSVLSHAHNALLLLWKGVTVVGPSYNDARANPVQIAPDMSYFRGLMPYFHGLMRTVTRPVFVEIPPASAAPP